MTHEDRLEKKRKKFGTMYRYDIDGYRTKQLKQKQDRYRNDKAHREAHKKACRERYHKNKALAS